MFCKYDENFAATSIFNFYPVQQINWSAKWPIMNSISENGNRRDIALLLYVSYATEC